MLALRQSKALHALVLTAGICIPRYFTKSLIISKVTIPQIFLSFDT